jgi:4-carboxymuconolactone decarboxylase
VSAKERLAPWTPEQLDDEARALYDAVLESPRGQGGARAILRREDGSLTGPFDAWLRTPELGRHLERVGMAFRTHTALSPAAREVTVLVVAQAWDAEFEWWVHGLIARREGVPEAAIEAIGQGRRASFEAEDCAASAEAAACAASAEAAACAASAEAAACAAAYDVAVELVHHRRLDDATLERARRVLGERALVECVSLVGFYQLVSGVLESFRPPPPSGDLPVAGPPTHGEPPR